MVAHTLASAARLAAESRVCPGFWQSCNRWAISPLTSHRSSDRARSQGFFAARTGATRPVLKLARRLTDAWAREWHDLVRTRVGAGGRSSSLGRTALSRSLPRALSTGAWRTATRLATPGTHNRVPVLPAAAAVARPQSCANSWRTASHHSCSPSVRPRSMIPALSSRRARRPSRRLGQRAIFFVGRGNEESSEDVSPEAIAVSYAPHDLVFPFARAIVHQGGIGTLSESLLAGKPMLIMPYGHDQADNAWRASRLGVARVVSRGRYRAGVVGRELSRMLDDPMPSVAALRVSRRFRGSGAGARRRPDRSRPTLG